MFDVTNKAVRQFKKRLAEAGSAGCGIRISMRWEGTSRCYLVEYVEYGKPGDRVIEKEGLKIFIDPGLDREAPNVTLDYEKGFILREPLKPRVKNTP